MGIIVLTTSLSISICLILIRPGGFVAFDDTGMPSIATVTDFVLTNRRYEFVRKCGDIVVLKKLGNDNETGTILKNSRCKKIGTALKNSRTLLFLQANKQFWVWHEQRERKKSYAGLNPRLPAKSCLAYGPQLAARCSFFTLTRDQENWAKTPGEIVAVCNSN